MFLRIKSLKSHFLKKSIGITLCGIIVLKWIMNWQDN